jgi:hypothetical protein
MFTKLNEYTNYLYYLEAPAIKGVNTNKILNLIEDSETRDMFFREPTDDDINFLNKYLKNNKFNLIELYHGTSSKNDIIEIGLLTTKIKTKKSLQSTPGYVYLSVFEDMAKKFGSFAYPTDDTVTYKITVPVYFIEPDLDQIRNVRMWSNENIGETLADSALYGHGFRIKGNIPPYMIKKLG